MAVIKEEVIAILREIPDDVNLLEIERALIVKSFPSIFQYSKKVEKHILKFEKLNRELQKLIKKTDLNPRYLQETIPIQTVKNSFFVERDFHIR